MVAYAVLNPDSAPNNHAGILQAFEERHSNTKCTRGPKSQKPHLMPSYRGSQMPCTTVQEIEIGMETGLLSLHRITTRSKKSRHHEEDWWDHASNFLSLHDQIWLCLFFVPLVHLGYFMGFVAGGYATADTVMLIILCCPPACSARCRGPVLDERPLSIELLCRIMWQVLLHEVAGVITRAVALHWDTNGTSPGGDGGWASALPVSGMRIQKISIDSCSSVIYLRGHFGLAGGGPCSPVVTKREHRAGCITQTTQGQ